MRRILWSAVFSLTAAALVLPASAKSHLTVEDARLIAFNHGIVSIEEIELDDGVWEIEGDDASGHEIRIEVEAWSGRIIKVRRH
jgi:hypothetical protein